MSDGPDTAPVQTDEGAADNQDSTVLTGADANSDAAPAADDTTTGNSDSVSTEEGSQATSPDTYADFAMPEGVTVDSALLEQATPIFKELGLTQEQAQKLVDIQAEQVQAGSQGQVDAFNQMMTDWQTQSKNDSEFGGDKFEENVGIARAAIDKFGTPELKELLESHGVGNHPEMIRFMIRVGKLTTEDVPGGSTAPANAEQDRVSILYPSKSA